MKRAWLIALVCMCLFLRAAAGQGMQTLTINEELRIDPIGNAAITINLSLTAAQYANWNQKYGQNKSLLKRDLGKIVSQYDTYDWDVQDNSMDRKVNVSVKAHGAVKHKGDGLYEFEVPKNWKGGQRNGNAIDYNFVEAGSGIIEQYNCKLVLPADAQNIKEDTGESGQRVLRYTVPVASAVSNAPFWIILTIGILIALFGLFVMGLGVIIPGGKKSPATA